MSGDSLTRPEFGPTLPELLRARFGVPERRSTRIGAVVAVVVVAVAVALVVRHRVAPGPQLIHRTPPVFNLLTSKALHRVAPQGDELVRLTGRRGPLTATITVAPLRVAGAHGGDVAHGVLPILAERYLDRLRAAEPGLTLHDEGRARVNDATGYQLGYRAPGHVKGRLVLLLPTDLDTSGVVLTFRQDSRRAKLGPRQKAFAKTARSEFRSFRFGTARG